MKIGFEWKWYLELMTPIFRLGVVRIGTTSDFGEIRPLGCSRSKTLFEVEVTKTSSSPSVTSLLEHSQQNKIFTQKNVLSNSFLIGFKFTWVWVKGQILDFFFLNVINISCFPINWNDQIDLRHRKLTLKITFQRFLTHLVNSLQGISKKCFVRFGWNRVVGWYRRVLNMTHFQLFAYLSYLYYIVFKENGKKKSEFQHGQTNWTNGVQKMLISNIQRYLGIWVL